MPDPFEGRIGLTAPATNAYAVTLDDEFSVPCRAIYVGGDGDVAVEMVGGQSVVFKRAKAGTFLTIRATSVLTAGTTATDLLALV